MDPPQFSDTFVNILFIVSIALLLFCIGISAYMVLSLSRWKEMRRKKKPMGHIIPFSEFMEESFIRKIRKKW